MKKLSLLFLLLCVTTLGFAAQEKTADVLGLRWGMSAEEVAGVMPSLKKVGKTGDLHSASPITIGKSRFMLLLKIGEDSGLHEVFLKASDASMDEFDDLVKALAARYDQRPKTSASEDELGKSYWAKWELPRTQLSINFLARHGWISMTYKARPSHSIIDSL